MSGPVSVASPRTQRKKTKLPIWLISRELAMLYSKEGGQKYIIKAGSVNSPITIPTTISWAFTMLTQARVHLHFFPHPMQVIFRVCLEAKSSHITICLPGGQDVQCPALPEKSDLLLQQLSQLLHTLSLHSSLLYCLL